MVDSVAGAVVSAAAVLLVAWMVASPLASSPFPQVASQVRQSALVQAVDDAVPDGVRNVYDNLRDAIDRRGLPDVLDPLTPTQVREVPAPDPALQSSPVVEAVQGSVVKISGIAPVVLPADRRLRLRLRAGAGDDQRARARGRHRAGRCSPRARSTTPPRSTSTRGPTSRCSPSRGCRPCRWRSRRTRPESGDDAIIMGYPGGGPFYVGAGPRARPR